jgi:hypothetical protein
MSKMKEQQLQQQERQMDYYYKFMDFVYDNLVSNELNSEEISRLEAEINSTLNCNRSLPKSSINNKQYNPKQGA